jgi:hypothetical protein
MRESQKRRPVPPRNSVFQSSLRSIERSGISDRLAVIGLKREYRSVIPLLVFDAVLHRIMDANRFASATYPKLSSSVAFT